MISSLQLLQVDIAIPEVFVGGLLGSMLIFLFSAWACAAVGRTAQEVVTEVRRQFIERPGIMVGIVVLISQIACIASFIAMVLDTLLTCARNTRRNLITVDVYL